LCFPFSLLTAWNDSSTTKETNKDTTFSMNGMNPDMKGDMGEPNQMVASMHASNRK
jgi:hypothetical protein